MENIISFVRIILFYEWPILGQLLFPILPTLDPENNFFPPKDKSQPGKEVLYVKHLFYKEALVFYIAIKPPYKLPQV